MAAISVRDLDEDVAAQLKVRAARHGIDTTVISEMMRDQPDRAVLGWADAVGRLHTTAITLAEVGYGIARLPDGHRKPASA
ncbi:MAG: FitA-like ribbon-helix-helix domain-containing protein [Pseudonocardia sp.]|jgi:predicted nucleic acid-binding protein